MQPTIKPVTKVNHSIPSDDSGKCPICNGTGYRFYNGAPPEGLYPPDAHVDFVPMRGNCPRCKSAYSEKVESAKKRSNIPHSFYDKKYDSFDWSIYKDAAGHTCNTTKYQELIDRFINNFPKVRNDGIGLYIYSITKGSGKTFLASCICNELIERYEIKTRFVSATQLLNLSQSTDKYSPDEIKRDPMKALKECELLVIDDIGQKKTGLDWLNEVLFGIIDDRMINKRITLFTSNIKIDDLPLDDRIVRRIADMTIPLQLPEYNARSRESNAVKRSFLEKLSLTADKNNPS